jgi:four helix bundle protein
MSRDPKRLRAYHLAHALALTVFRHSSSLPPSQRFVIQQQLQRAALSVPCNIVEGCARRRLPEYRHFANIALGSAHETGYLIQLATELGYLPGAATTECRDCCAAVVGALQNLMKALEHME